MPRGGCAVLDQEGGLLGVSTSEKKTLYHATQAGEPSVGCEKNTATTLLLNI